MMSDDIADYRKHIAACGVCQQAMADQLDQLDLTAETIGALCLEGKQRLQVVAGVILDRKIHNIAAQQKKWKHEGRLRMMVFEVGKYYRHSGHGDELHILGAVTGSLYHMGPLILVAEEFGSGKPMFVGSDEASAENWSECPPWFVDEENARVLQALVECNDACTRTGCFKCGGSGLIGQRSRCPGQRAHRA